jgi:maltose O-acetyltransferase
MHPFTAQWLRSTPRRRADASMNGSVRVVDECISTAAPRQLRPHGRELVRKILTAVAGEIGTIRCRWLLASGIAHLLPRHSFYRVRTMLYRAGGLRIGRGSIFFGPIVVWGGATFTVGRNCRINSPVHVELEADVLLGDHVSIGHGVTFVTANHEIGGAMDRCGPIRGASIHVENGCWIGAGVLIKPGVTLGRGCVVAAGSVVTADVPPDKLVGGVPARLIRVL